MAEFRFIHTSDLHLGCRFGNFPEEIRGRLVEARHAVIDRLAQAAREHEAGHVLVAGDLFDTGTPSNRIWRQALSEMGAADSIQWWILPGNHDSLAAQTLWENLRAHAAGNVHPVCEPEPIRIAAGVELLPAPVPSRSPGRDLTEWMAAVPASEGCLRIGLAHGSVFGFGGGEDEEAEVIPPDRAASASLDYLALGDWHGFRRIGERVFYSGAPERDRFKHQGRGICLAVTIPGPGAVPQVAEVSTGRFDWSEVSLSLTPDQDVSAALAAALPPAGKDRRDTLLRLNASGRVRLAQRRQLEMQDDAVGQDFGYFQIRDEDLKSEHAPEDLDSIARDGVLRMAAEELHKQAGDEEADKRQRAIAQAALHRLYSYVMEDRE